ncbi:tyrosine-type recombinase/integrase [Mesorhizobium sp. L48C026A00]|uniref:tyrosine-type recombinase/integrase n=1 Tax=Mesorhizobium sp. L48C026A00 TaxID=1287182 RepID=UPI0003CFF8BB|nr:tyrosine-type recombinase/integrase [Mesorhizobium sp. L48C026A00]ESZ12139.1 hypothetical protein X737_27435 [Mesorhizobium sp. L48C026A00]
MGMARNDIGETCSAAAFDSKITQERAQAGRQLLDGSIAGLARAVQEKAANGSRDRAMLHLAVCAGLRVSELTGLKLEDIDLSSMCIRVLGKGRRERTLPLWKTTAAALRAWLAVRGRVAAPEVFVNAGACR